jgi:enoyl-CoA hydratase
VSLVAIERRDDGIAVATVDRPPANALDLELMRDLVAAARELAADPPRATVLAGTERVFCAGADLKLAPTWGPEEQRAGVQGINDMARGFYELPFPLVGAITGHAIAGGMVLALTTDVRVASRAGRYGLTEVKVGIPYPAAAIELVRAELPPHAARLLALGGRLYGAEECLAVGVFDELAADGPAALDRALAIAAELAELDGDTYARTKAGLRRAAWDVMARGAEADPLLERWV